MEAENSRSGRQKLAEWEPKLEQSLRDHPDTRKKMALERKVRAEAMLEAQALERETESLEAQVEEGE